MPFVIVRANSLSEDFKYSFAVSSAGHRFKASIVAPVLSLIGNGPVRLPASLASFGLAAFWFVAAFLYYKSISVSSFGDGSA